MARNRNRTTEPTTTEQEPTTVNTEPTAEPIPTVPTTTPGTIAAEPEQEPTTVNTDTEQEPTTVNTDTEPTTDTEPEQEPTTAPTPEPTAAERDAAAALTFTTAYAAAVDHAREQAGAIDAAAMGAVEHAYRSIRPARRSAVLGAVSADAMGAAMDAEPMDVHALAAVRAIATALAAVDATPATRERVAADPRAAAADAVAVLTCALGVVLGAWSDADAAAIRDAAAERGADAGRVLAAINGATGRRGGRSTGTPSPSTTTDGARAATGTIAAHVAAVVAAAEPGAVLTVAAIKRAGSDHYAPGTASAGAITNAIRRGGIAGVIATRDDGGALAATAAPADAEPTADADAAATA